MSAISDAVSKHVEKNLEFIRNSIQPTNHHSPEDCAAWLVNYMRSVEEFEYGLMRTDAITNRNRLNGGYTKASH